MGLFVRCVFLGLPVGRGSARDAERCQVSRSRQPVRADEANLPTWRWIVPS